MQREREYGGRAVPGPAPGGRRQPRTDGRPRTDQGGRRWKPSVTQILGAAGLAALLFAESRSPLRRPVATRASRLPRNLLLAAGSALVVNLLENPLARRLARRVERGRQGLIPALGLRRWAETVLGMLLLDYTLYHWHRLTHHVPLLWRFHSTHHRDPDLDVSTGVGFHPLEMLLSVPFRLLQVRLLGITPKALKAWKRLLLPAVLLHHSNLRLPRGLERSLSFFFVTPRMHGIHHSDRPSEQSSNWSSLLAAWDRLHRTFRFDVPQDSIRIGPLRGPGGARRAGGVAPGAHASRRRGRVRPQDRDGAGHRG
jgi:sterol desaturase/sphingolipid hydroxylase (fatty acid hydroxylase superfamily)